MRIVRYQPAPGEAPLWGWVSEDRIGRIDKTPFAPYRREVATLQAETVRVLAPVAPGKIIGIGRNYAAHAVEQEVEIPELPLLFLKAPSSVIGPGEAISLPPQSQQVEHEAELAIVIGTPGRWIAPPDVPDHILGYTIANDVTARDLQRNDGQWARGKSFDTFCPLGPWIETELDPADAVITCSVNGQMRQMASTRDMIFPVRQLVAFVSSVMTLEPGDVILTGTPAGVGALQHGDEVTIEIEGLGRLTNPVRRERQLG